MIQGISSMATRQLLDELALEYQQARGVPVQFESVGGVDAARRVADGEAFDVVVLAANVIDQLITAGRVVAGSRKDLVRSGVSIAVRSGTPHPAIDCEQALRESLLTARSIGYSTGPSGTALIALLERWGIAAELKDRLVQARPGHPVGKLIASGDVEIGFQQYSELMNLPGIDVIGPMPPGLEIITTFSAGLCSASTQPQAARALIDYLAGSASMPPKQRNGMDPA